MKVNILSLINGARKAEGLTVIIDVFRAFSVACYVFANGAEKIFPVGELKRAYNLKAKNPEYILIGEREGKKLPECNYGNSPAEVEKVDFTGKKVIHTTSAGTQGIVNSVNAEEVITGSFVNVQAVVNYIKSSGPEVVSLVGMGEAGKVTAEEDMMCCQYMKDLLLDKKPQKFNEIREKLKNGNGRKFFDSDKNWYKKRDFQLCMKLNKFNFVLKTELFNLEGNEKLISLQKEEV
ncbi:MAG: 2-phosphosulfolactate phosphatase [Bacillota bacterium]